MQTPLPTYHIDQQLSEQDRALVICIQETGARLSTVTDPKHLNALQYLQQQESLYRKKMGKHSLDPLIYHVAYPQTLEALKRIAGTGKLYFNKKEIICDFFGKAEVYLEVDATIRGRVKTLDQDFSLNDCDFICGGPPHWYVKGIILRPFQTELSWSNLKKLWAGEASPEILEEDDIQVIYKGNSREELLRQKEPTPILMLKDRSGAFADLWMDYGDGLVPYHENVKPNTLRMPDVEKNWEKDLLETAFIKKMVGSTHYFCPMDQVAKSLTFLLEVGWKIQDWQGRRVLQKGAAEIDLQSAEDAILIKGKVRFEDHEARVEDAVGAFTRRQRFIELSPNSVGLMPDTLEGWGLEAVAEEAVISGGALRINRRSIALLEDIQASMPPSLAELKERLQTFTGLAFAPPDPSFKGILRPYQQEGVNWLQFLYGYGFSGMLADDMGLGKTVQVLAFLSRLPKGRPVIIVLPTTLIFNWKREIGHFLPDVQLKVHHGPLRSKDGVDLEKTDIILTSYSTMRMDLPLLSSLQYAAIILDEAQAIKNPHTQTAKAIVSLHSPFRLSLTGTPIENHLNEVWSHFHFLMPGLLDNLKTFEAEVQASSSDSRYLTRIRKKIRPFLLRRKKEDVALDLPEKIEQTVWVEMEPAQRNIYESFLSGVRSGLLSKVALEGMGKHRMEVLEAILRLRQICCHPLLISAHLENEGQALTSAKFDTLMEDLNTVVEEGKKALVYSQFTSMLSIISKELRHKGLHFVYLDGSTVNREGIVNQFQEDPAIPLFLISLKAGGVGLNLTAADYVFLYDPWWNEAAENQAIDRAHRIGRSTTVFAKRYVCVESIEEKMMKLKKQKSDLVEGILEGDLKGLTEDDLRFLLT